MSRFSDPFLCPDCGTRLPYDPLSCPACALPLRGPLATSLYQTLQSADQLLLQLRASATTEPVVSSAPPMPAAQMAPAAARPPRTGMRAASVPTILLGLGALCLLVAAVTFLAVAWSWLGVGGRTAVLVALTVTAGALGSWLGGRGLRLAAESLTLVALGLLALDVVGADNAGWFGDLSTEAEACVVGGVLLFAALALLLTPARLGVPQVVAPIGLFILMVGASALTAHNQVAAATAVLAFGVLAWVGRLLGERLLPWAACVGGVIWWALLAVLGLADAIDNATVRGMWAEGHGIALLTASALLLLPVAFAPSKNLVRQTCGAAAATLATVTLALPGLDDGATRLTIVALVFLLLWSAAAALTPSRWALVSRLPMALAALPVLTVSARLLLEAVDSALGVDETFSRGAGVRLDPGTADAHPALLVASALALLVALAVVVPGSTRIPRQVTAAIPVLAGIGTLALYPVPLWTVTAALCLVATALVGDAVRRTDRFGTGEAVAGGLVALVAVAVALPSDWLTTGSTAVLVLASVAVSAVGRFPYARLAGWLVLPAAAAWLIWAAAEVGSFDEAHRGVPVLLVVGLMAVLRPRVEVESSAGLAAFAASATAVSAATDQSGSLALHLTLAGALVCASALLNPARRVAGWLGGLLLAGAMWVRLADLGVHAPEAYTLPVAVALVLVGLHRLRRDPPASTLTALAPGLSLATTPSLLWVLAGDVVTLRAALLGVGCLALVLIGTLLRWNAPLVVGAAVGMLLVLRELAPYAAATPQWVLIGLAGTLLTVVGVTWEQRMLELQRASAYLDRLR